MNTKIEWCDKVWNPVTGCSPVSTGCEHCYAARMANRLRGRCGYPADEPFQVTLHPEKLGEPMRWRSTRIFVNSMSDLFHENVPFEFIDEVFKVIAFEHTHKFMILTKRPERMKQYLTEDRPNHKLVGYNRNGDPVNWPLFNLWLGVTAENQQMADERIPILLQIPAAVRLVSIEPMLGPVSLKGFDGKIYRPWLDSNAQDVLIDWVICGPETGPKARPMKSKWICDLYRQCTDVEVPFFDKKNVLGLNLKQFPEVTRLEK